MILSPTPVSSRRFYWDASTLTFVADLSDLGKDFQFGRVYDDACDIGLTLVSQRTGTEVVFAIEDEKRDSEGELQYIELIPAKRGELPDGVTVRLYND